MKAKAKWLRASASYMGAVLFLLGAGLQVFADEDVQREEAANLAGVNQAGVELILDADLSQDDQTLLANAIDVNGSKAEKEEQTQGMVQTDPALFMVNNVSTKLNVREEPDKEAKIVGALYADCGGTIMERKNGWTKVKSGNLIGWANDEYLIYGDDARAMAAQVGATIGKVQISGLTVRKEPSRSASSFAVLAQGDMVEVFCLDGNYVGIDCEGRDGYIAREYVKLNFIIDHGETNEEIAQREKEEREAAAAAAAMSAARKEALKAEKEAVTAVYTDLQMLAAIVYTEAGNQPYEGQVAVAAVVLNRVNSPAYPNSVPGVLYASGQFSPVLSGRFAKCLEKGTYERCIQAAKDALAGVNPIGSACHFHRVGSRTDGIVIGDHIFY